MLKKHLFKVVHDLHGMEDPEAAVGMRRFS